MITTIIFSKDRACQLDLLLRSIQQNFQHITSDIKILYKATTPEFEAGYDLLFNKCDDIYVRRQQEDEDQFQKDTLGLIGLSNDYICFFVDDNVVYRQPEVFGYQIVQIMEQIEDAGCFSLRLGKNTIVQDPYSGKPVNPMPQFMTIGGYILAWDWTTLPLNNFSYPFSVDGHIYSKQLLRDSLDYQFDTPNAFEGRFPMNRIPQGMFCLTHSCVVNNPLNLVGSSQNKAGVWYGHTLEDMNEQYLAGKQINLQFLCENKIVGCHQEMKITYE